MRGAIIVIAGDTLAVHELFGLLGPSANMFCREFHEEIVDVETFSLLDETDFNRLNLNTGQRKKNQKIQAEIISNSKNTTKESIKNELYEEYEYIEQEDELGVSLEKEFDIDCVFQQTPEGRNIIELLKEQNSINSKLIKAITTVLPEVSEYLINRFGYHPSAHHKNVVALSLVNKYDVLKSNSAAMPQALWFYPHGRGHGRHSGKLHYHIEYMVKKFEKQIRRTKEENADSAKAHNAANDDLTGDGLVDMITKLKFIVPSEASFEVIKTDWMKTVEARNVLRKKDKSEDLADKMTDMFPLSTAFNGLLINLDFTQMFPETIENSSNWSLLQDKVLTKFKHFHPTVNTQFIRSLLIIKEKNPSRGAKRANKGSQKISNLLEGIVEWIKKMYPEDDINQYVVGYRSTKNPVMIVKAQLYAEGECYIRIGKRFFSVGSEIEQAFTTLIKTHYFFSYKFEPAHANFFSLFTGAILNVAKPSTTVTDFLVQLK
ncbi:uncharacterized protein LOC135707901 [Ochlerotatus camptorhynchus]|uniref:uncharacterized protein LOC135707901 n=1 Tax=Ochlerotatus camptorhynchus TaxID=644619 RepID=UPI0031E072CE